MVYVGAGTPPIGGNIDTGTTNVHAVCRPQALNRGAREDEENPAEHRQPVMAEDFEPLPITPDFYRCQLGDFEAGSYNVSVQLPMGLAWANPVDTGLFSHDGRGTKYQVQYYPVVNEMSPQEGSLAGGTEVTIRGHGFSMDEADIDITLGGSPCAVVTSTLEEIVCVTGPAAEFSCATGSGVTECASCASPLTAQDECASCNAGATLLAGGVCRADATVPSATLTLDDADAEVVGMATQTAGDGSSFVSDQGQGKGTGWAIFTGAVTESGRYEVRLAVPTTAGCSGASAVPVVVHHSETARRTVVAADLSTAGSVTLGTFFLAAPTTARVVVDNTGTSGCVAVDKIELVPAAAAHGPSDGCTDSAAVNFEPAATTDDGSCLFVGGRGLLRQQWALLPTDTQDDIAASSPAAVAKTPVVVDRACPRPGDESGWDFLSGDGSAGDCSSGRCPSHDACPADAFCCVDGAHARCTPAIGDASAFDSDDGWKLVFRQILPSRDRQNGGYWQPGTLRKNSDDPDNSLYSILDELEAMHTDDHMYELKLRYPGLGDMHWKQSVNPISGDSLLTSNFAWVDDPTPTWHLMFKQEDCRVTYDAGATAFNQLFARSTWPLVRYDRRDSSATAGPPGGIPGFPGGFPGGVPDVPSAPTDENAPDPTMSPYAYYRRLTPVPRGMSLYDTLLSGWTSDTTPGNIQDTDWRAFNTETEALDDVNPWAECKYDGQDERGFPGDCGPEGPELMKWISKTGCEAFASPNVALYIYAPAKAATIQPPKFRGLSSKIAAKHGHLLDGEGLDVITPHDDTDYIPWFGLGVTQDAPAHTWQEGIDEVLNEGSGFTWHWWNHHGNIQALRDKATFPDTPDGTLKLGPGGDSHAHTYPNGGPLLHAEIPPNIRDRYAGRMFGYYRADQDGDHTFYISSDDNGELWFGEEEESATLIASVPGWTGVRNWNRFPEQRSAPQPLRKGKFYYIEALFQEGGGGDNLAIGVIKPDLTESMPIEVQGHLYKSRVDVTSPRSMELLPCAAEGEQCEFSGMSVVKYSIGWEAVPPLYSVETDGVRCSAFGAGIGGDAYVHVATDRICAGTTAGEEIPSEPDHLGSEATDEEVLDDCRRKCDERADCTHFVSWDNQACKTYATCLVTEPGPDEVVTGQAASSERLYVNTRRAPGKCHVVPISGKWNACSEEDELCEVDTLSIVRFGAGKSFKYRLLDVDAATGFGNLTCSTRTFGLGSPGLRRCEAAFVGVPARIAGPDPAFVEHVELYAKPRTNAGPVCQLCDGCIDADGRVIRRSLAHGSSDVSWTDGSTAGPAVQGAISTTVDGVTANSGILGGSNLETSCSIASGDANLAWRVDLGSDQGVTSVRLSSSVSAHAGVGTYDAGYTDVSVVVSSSDDPAAGTSCGTVANLHPGSHVEVECGATGRYVFVASGSGLLGLCEVEVLGSAPACPDFCVADQPAYPAPISATHQMVTWTNGLTPDSGCDPLTTACDGDVEKLQAELPAKSPLRLGGTRYQALFVAPTDGVYTFRARFDDVGELWLSRDADPRHSELVIDSSAGSNGGWFGPKHDPHQAHIALDVVSRFSGPLYISLLGSAAKTEEMLLVRGSAGWELPAAGGCPVGEAFAEYFENGLQNTVAVASQCQGVGGRKGYIIELPDTADTAAELGAGSDYGIRFTVSAYFPADAQYTITSSPQGTALVSISGAIIGPRVSNPWKGGFSEDVWLKAGVHTVVYSFRSPSGGGGVELRWAMLPTAVSEGTDFIEASSSIAQEHVRDIVPVNQHGHPTDLGSVRAIRLRNPDDTTCLGTVAVTVRGRRYIFRGSSCFTGEAELDVVAAEPILDLASHPASDAVVGDARVPRDGLVSWHKWSTWDAGKQVWADASGNGNDGRVTVGVVQTSVGTGHGASGNIGYIAGFSGTAFSWGRVIHPQFTICSVTRYTGSKRGRILNGADINWLHGHHAAHAGVAFYEGWKTPQNNNALFADVEDWVVLCGKNVSIHLYPTARVVALI